MEVVNCDEKTMRSCKYGCYLNSQLFSCDYIIIEGHSRPCKHSECIFYEKRVEKKYNSPFGKELHKRRFIDRKNKYWNMCEEKDYE